MRKQTSYVCYQKYITYDLEANTNLQTNWLRKSKTDIKLIKFIRWNWQSNWNDLKDLYVYLIINNIHNTIKNIQRKKK